jgi:hypothetical protein
MSESRAVGGIFCISSPRDLSTKTKWYVSEKSQVSEVDSKRKLVLSFRLLAYKAEWYGRKISQVPFHFQSSQICHECATKNPKVKELSVREWICSTCRTLNQRDYNASLKEGLRQLT